MKIRWIGRFLLPIVALGFLSSTVTVLRATPFAGEVTNNNGTIQFYINESGGNVTVTYNDGTTNANFNGITTGTNEPSGSYSFPLGGHTSYSISISKVGLGYPTVIQTVSESGGTVNPRGVDVNKNIGSPYFGRIYWADGDGGGNTPGVFLMNPDFSFIGSNAPQTAGISIFNSTFSGTDYTATGTSPYRLSVATNDFVVVGGASECGAGVWLIDPNFQTNQLLLGPVGAVKYGAGGVEKKYTPYNSLGTIESNPLITGSLSTSNLVLYDVDGELTPSDCLEVYDIGAGPLPWTNAPTYTGYQIALGLGFDAIDLGGNEYCGLSFLTNGDIYANTYRDNLSNPTLQLYDPTGQTNLWNSWLPDGTAYPQGTPSSDWLVLYTSGAQSALVDSQVTPDGAYIFGVDFYNDIVICPLINGIPNMAGLETEENPLGVTSICRGVASDAADNLYESSSGLGTLQEWSLGLAATTVTTGNASGVTGFQVLYPPYSGNVTVGNSFISQPNSYGNPTSTTFLIQLASPPTNTLTVNYSFSGTALGATNGGLSYPATFTANPPGSVTFLAGQSQAVVTVTAVVDSIPRPTTALTMTLGTSIAFQPEVPVSASINILNTGPQTLITAVGAPSMYDAFSNDYCSFAITRWGDTNVSAYTVNSSSFSITGGTAIKGTDYTAPSSVTINPGDLTDYSYIYPLINGKAPIHTNIMAYTGNKTITAALESSGGYTAVANTNAFAIIDAANPPATILYSDPLTNSAPTNWTIKATDANYPVTPPNYYANFGYNLTNSAEDQYGPQIPNPPNGQGYSLRVTANKDSSDSTADSGSGLTTYSTAVNLYPTNVTFSGNYAVRFNMNVTQPYVFCTQGSYEGPVFGINHSGALTNWWANNSASGPTISASAEVDWNIDGLWVWMTDDAYSEFDAYNLFSWNGTTTNAPQAPTLLVGANEPAFANNFKTNVFTSLSGNPATPDPGLPANGSADNLGSTALTSWADVELKQYNNVVTLSIDKTPIFVYTNTTPFTNGLIMLGYDSPVFGTDGADGAAYFSNLQVVRLGPPAITGTAYSPQTSTFTFDFTTPDGSLTTSSFVVMGAATVNGPYTAVSGATITQLRTGAYQATVPVSGPTQFYRVNQQL